MTPEHFKSLLNKGIQQSGLRMLSILSKNKEMYKEALKITIK